MPLQSGLRGRLTFSLLAASLCASASAQNLANGQITAGQPRIWKYERVYSLMDGLLRDVEAVQLQTLDNLKPNEVNSTSINMLQTMLRTGVLYDQGQALNNSFGEQNLKANQESQVQAAKLWDDSSAALRKQQAALLDEQTAASKKKRDMQNALDDATKADQDANAGTDADKTKAADAALKNAQANFKSADDELQETNAKIATNTSAISQLGSRPALSGSVTDTDASSLLDPSKTQAPFGSGWAKLPDDVRTALLSQIKQAQPCRRASSSTTTSRYFTSGWRSSLTPSMTTRPAPMTVCCT